MLRATCFGPWLALVDETIDPLLVLMFLQCEVERQDGGEHEMFYEVCGHTHRYGRKEFCLITGFRFGDIPSVRKTSGGVLAERLSRGDPNIYCSYCIDWVSDVLKAPKEYSDAEAIRLILLAMASAIFLGLQGNVKVPQLLIDLVGDLDAWNKFP